MAVSVACLFASCGSGSSKKTPEGTETKQEEQAGTKVEEPKATPIPENVSEEPVVELETSMGVVKVKLFKDTPLHRDNFIKLVSEGFYNGVLFHRVIKDFMIQTGDPESIGAASDKPLGGGGPGYNVPAEILPNHYHKKGALSAARRDDSVNPNRESSGSQFYIVQGTVYDDAGLDAMEQRSGIKYTQEQRNAYKTLGGTPHLDGGYTVFGEVIEGLDIVDAIAGVQTGSRDRPTADVKLIKATIVE